MSVPSRRPRPVVLALIVVLVATACTGVGATEPSEAGDVVIKVVDNRFSPSTIKVKVGQRVRFVIENEGRHVHEFMVGREPVPGKDYLVSDVWMPFEQDFWEGIDVEISGNGMPMGFGTMEGMGSEQGDGHDGAPSGGMGEGTMGSSGGGHDEAPSGGMDMGGGEEGHHGAMVMLQPGDPGAARPGQTAVIEFTVPADKVGTWEIGCFQEAGQHYEDGMRGTLIVEG